MQTVYIIYAQYELIFMNRWCFFTSKQLENIRMYVYVRLIGCFLFYVKLAVLSFVYYVRGTQVHNATAEYM